MICVSIGTVEFQRCLAIVRDSQMAEVRLDKNCYSEEQIRQLFSTPQPLIATFRAGTVPENSRLRMLDTAIAAGAAYVDLAVDDSDEACNFIIKSAAAHNCKIILSYHNYDATPTRSALLKIVERCFDRGADIVKITCSVRDGREAARLLSLYDSPRAASAQIIALGMGDRGRITRIAATSLGAPFTYAFAEQVGPTAPGQLSERTLTSILGIMNNG